VADARMLGLKAEVVSKIKALEATVEDACKVLQCVLEVSEANNG
jgi:hypothetical protein